MEDLLKQIENAPPIDDPDTGPDMIELDAEGNRVERHPTRLLDDLASLDETA